jgi:hypothetical protein
MIKEKQSTGMHLHPSWQVSAWFNCYDGPGLWEQNTMIVGVLSIPLRSRSLGLEGDETNGGSGDHLEVFAPACTF